MAGGGWDWKPDPYYLQVSTPVLQEDKGCIHWKCTTFYNTVYILVPVYVCIAIYFGIFTFQQRC